MLVLLAPCPQIFNEPNVVSKWVKLRVFVRNLRQIHHTASGKAHYKYTGICIVDIVEHTVRVYRDNEVSPYSLRHWCITYHYAGYCSSYRPS
jgi:hypothetical protein